MKPRELFSLGVRLLGVWLLYSSATYVAGFADMKLFPSTPRAQDSATSYLIYAMTHFSIAVFFLLWTETLVNWSYGNEGMPKDVEPEHDSVREG